MSHAGMLLTAALAVGFPVRACNLMPARQPGVAEAVPEPRGPSKREPTPERVVLRGAPRPPLKPATFPEGVVIRVLDGLQPAFMRCYLRALDRDPSLGPVKVMLHLEVSEWGSVMTSRAVVADLRFAACVASVARALAFPATGDAAWLDVPLFFRR